MDQASVLKTVDPPLFIINRKGERDWTKFGIESVLADFGTGKQITEIAKLYNTTRGSISGVIARARLRGEFPLPIKSPTKGVRKRKTVSGPRYDPVELRLIAAIKQLGKKPPEQHRVRLRVIESDTEVTLEQLQSHHCKWPIGDPKLPDFRFCGKQRLASCSYCPEHAAKNVRSGVAKR
jgi:hypothetical protein